VNVVDVRPVVGAFVGARVTTGHELVKELARLLTVHDTGEGRVLSQHAHAGMPHHENEESRLTFGEVELAGQL
jgi:hypothetical protein